MSGMYPCAAAFQPTHPHGVRLPEHFPFSASHIVSTHAPARGATINVKKIEVVILVSTHAPARGATVSAGSDTVGGCVSTHAPARGATSLRPVLRYLHPVSTHAPARGATTTLDWTKLDSISFNPRTRTGCDRKALSEEQQGRSFQPTHPHGVRQYPASVLCNFYCCFNPRTRTGCDIDFSGTAWPRQSVSTHAPARGATVIGWWKLKDDDVSTHAPARGATSLLSRARARSVSTHAPARSAT